MGPTQYLLPIVLIIACYSIHVSSFRHYPPPAPFHPPNTAQRIEACGYPAETHQVTTEDGYILTIFRIPHGKNKPATKPKPLILHHGVLCSSDCWVLTDDDEALGYLLADAGFDVWLTNSRGNIYNRAHVKYSSKDPRFWNFSFHEMGYYDMPAIIDYILGLTGEESLSYIGHSQGTAVFFVMASSRPEYNRKVKVMSALAPIAYLNNTKGAIRTLGRLSKFLIKAAYLFNLNYVLDRSMVIALFDQILCRLNPTFCEDLVSFIVGFDSVHMDKGLIPYMADICPTGASVKQLIHFNQLIHNGGKFTWFDYGPDNYDIYHSKDPPEYNLSAITVPVLLYYGPNDYISSISEVKGIYSKLPKVPDIKEISTYNHLDFMWGTDAKELLFDHMIQVMLRYC